MKFVFLLIFLFLQCLGIAQGTEEIQKSTVDLAQLQNSSILDEKVQAQFLKILNEAKLWELPRADLKKMISDNSKGKPAEKVFKTVPKLLDLATNMLGSKDAFPGLLKILGRTDALKQYFYIWLFLLVTTWLVKKYLFPEEPNFWRRTFTKLMFSGFMSAVSISVFYVFFHEELTPTFKVITQTFWSA